VVHGIGEQAWAETAAILRSGFEDALDAIRKWEGEQGVVSPLLANERYIPPPYIAEGFWADYSDFKKTFKDDWEKLTDHARVFFEYLWKLRSLSLGRTYIWFFSQQFRLLRPSVLKAVGIRRWLLYIPFQMLSLAILTLALLRYPRLISGFLADVRLYLDPKGLVENVIVQRIDQRVGEKFLLMIGLDWEFRPLPDDQLATEMGVKIRFDRVVWVAHSLGSVISYNVLSDLFHRAVELGQAGDAKQQEGVKRFREALSRFITIGSPLDKVAFLFGHRALKPWPSVGRDKLLYRGDTFSANDQSESRE
jgi:hypothetical protein